MFRVLVTLMMKTSSMQPSPMESPSHPSSFGPHSRNSSASRFSGIFRLSSGRKGNRKRNDKGWPECNVINGRRPYKAEITVKLKKYYQPGKSRRTVSVVLEGKKVPIYGAGSSLTFTQNGAEIPLILKFKSVQENVVGKLVRTKHRRQISCPLVIDSTRTKPIKFKETCTYD
ncbi:hypothetical protein CRYUN_Cryun37aG0047200 [Craigia yunnanensis]